MSEIIFNLQRFAVIFNNYLNDTLLSGTANNDTIENWGTNMTIDGGTGNDVLKTVRTAVIYGGAGNDSLYNHNFDGIDTDGYLFDGGEGNDRLETGTGSRHTLLGGAGNDIYDAGSDYTLIEDSGGNNAIGNYGDYVTIKSGNGNDHVTNWGSNVLISMGGGTNTITAHADNAFRYHEESSNVTIIGGKGKDIISTGTVPNVRISAGAGDDNISSYGGKKVTISGDTGNDRIQLDSSKSNALIRFGSGDGNDTIWGFNSDDTLQITSGTIASSVVSGGNLTLKVGDGKIVLSEVAGSTLKVKLASGKVINLKVPSSSGGTTSDSGSSDDSGTDTTSGGDSGNMDGITVSNGTVYVGADFEGDTIDLADYPSSVSKVYASTYGGDLEILGTSKNNSLVGGKGDDLISGGAGKDTLTGGKGDDVFIHTEGKDIITDYTVGEDIIQLENGIDDISSSKFSGKNIIFTTETGSITVKGGKGKKITFADSQGHEEIWGTTDTLPKGLTYNANKAILTAAKNFTEDKIDVSDYSQTTNAKIINAKAVTNNVEIIGNKLNNSIISGSGDDTLYGGRGMDTLTGGKGNDIFMHVNGNDVITDYTVGQDVIYLGEGIEITNAKLNVKDIILTTSVGTVTIKDGKNKKITVMDSEGDETTKIYPVSKMTGLSYSNNKTVLTVKKTFAGETIELDDYASTVKTVNAKAATVKVDIIGNKLNNSLVGGKGDDTLAGGAGKDTLTGGKGEDTFVYTKGNDVITDYKQGEDIIQLDDGVKIKSWKISGSNVVFTTSSGKITVKDGKNKKITIVDANDKASTKEYSSNKNVSSLWFAEENNFVTSDNLSSITENNLTPTSLEKITTTNYENLTQENNFVTYGEK